MKYKDLNIHDGESPIAKLVMERIRREEPWSFSNGNQLFQLSLRSIRWLTALGIILLTLSLFLLIAGLSGKIGNQMGEESTYAVNQITGIGEIGYAESNSAAFSLSVDDMVASIGDAFMISGYHGSKSLNFPLLISVFIFFEVLLLMNWITRYSKS